MHFVTLELKSINLTQEGSLEMYKMQGEVIFVVADNECGIDFSSRYSTSWSYQFIKFRFVSLSRICLVCIQMQPFCRISLWRRHARFACHLRQGSTWLRRQSATNFKQSFSSLPQMFSAFSYCLLWTPSLDVYIYIATLGCKVLFYVQIAHQAIDISTFVSPSFYPR